MFQFYSIMTTYTDLPIKSRLRLYFFMRGIRTGHIKIIEIDT